jgi:hypothetical protein
METHPVIKVELSVPKEMRARAGEVLEKPPAGAF